MNDRQVYFRPNAFMWQWMDALSGGELRRRTEEEDRRIDQEARKQKPVFPSHP